MMERVVPLGSSFLGCGTMAIRPAAFLLFGVAAPLGDEAEAVFGPHADDVARAETSRH